MSGRSTPAGDWLQERTRGLHLQTPGVATPAAAAAAGGPHEVVMGDVDAAGGGEVRSSLVLPRLWRRADTSTQAARPRHDARRPLPTPSLRPAARRPLPHSLARLRLVVALLVPAPAQRPSTTRRPAAASAPRRLAAAAALLWRAGRVLLVGGRARRGHGHGFGHGALGVRRLGAQHGLGRRVRGRGGHAARRAGTGAGSGSGSGSGVAAQAFWRWGRPRGRRRRGRVEGHDGVSRRLREVREAGAGALDACRVELVRRREDEERFFCSVPPHSHTIWIPCTALDQAHVRYLLSPTLCAVLSWLL